MNNICGFLHELFLNGKRLRFPDGFTSAPSNGIYLLFEHGEQGHGADRIVRVGTHTGKNQLVSRLRQHFVNENKDRSIFRKNIGRAMLHRERDPFLEDWEIDLTTRKARKLYEERIDTEKKQDIERQVSKYIQKNFSVIVFSEPDKFRRLKLESKIISTVSWCDTCAPSEKWLGLHSPKKKIRESGLWLVNGLYKESLSDQEFDDLRNRI